MSISLIILLIANYIFYAYWDLKSLPVLCVMSIFTWAGGALIYHLRPRSKDGTVKTLCLLLIACQVFVLCFFKYSGTYSLPVGMSFYILMAISFLADVYRGEFDSLPPLAVVMCYISFFPTVLSGPIMKSKDLIPQFSSRKKPTGERITSALWMIVLGVFLKLVMADRLCVSVDKVYSAPLVYSGLTLFMASIGYTLQLLFDFAGYSYIAVGVAKILGYDVMRNFNLPYLAANPSEFWRRWHISLSSWFKDYLYIPLGGSRRGEVRTCLNIMIVMIVSGLWHGSTVNFFIWGILHGLGQVIHRIWKITKKNAQPSAAVRILSIFINFLFVNFLWIPFRAPDLDTSWTIFRRIITFAPGSSYFYVYTFIFMSVLLAIMIYGGVKNNGNNPLKALPLDRFSGRLVFCIMLFAIGMFAYFGNSAFIYAAF